MLTQRLSLIAIVFCFLSACTAHTGASFPDGLPGGASMRPDVVQKGKGAQFVQFTPHTLGALYSAIVAGPDGNMWFIDENAGDLVRMSLGGAIKEFRISFTGNAVSMTVGADKRFYVSDESTSIVRISTNGTAKFIPIPSGDSTSIDGNALGPDGNVWFTEFNHIAKVTPAGKVTEFAYPNQPGTNQYGGVTVGSDGNVWFAESSQNSIGRIVPSTGAITMFSIPVSCTPAPVVLGNDANVWFFCLTTSPELGFITPGGSISMFSIGGTFGSNETEQFCARGPDGEPWCASGNDNTVFRVNTASHTVTTFSPPLSPGARPDAVAAGPDGNLWIDSVGGDIDVLVTNPMTVSPLKLTFTGTGQMQTVTVSESGVSSWTATSSNTGVATVTQGGSNSTFNVTSVGIGTCKITISDSVGNKVNVKVTVT